MNHLIYVMHSKYDFCFTQLNNLYPNVVLIWIIVSSIRLPYLQV